MKQSKSKKVKKIYDYGSKPTPFQVLRFGTTLVGGAAGASVGGGVGALVGMGIGDVVYRKGMDHLFYPKKKRHLKR